MADWSQLPPELILLLAEHLETRFDILRFRSICSLWRSTCTPKIHPLLPTFLPRLTRGILHSTPTKITRNTFYLIKSSPAHAHADANSCWLAKIRDGAEAVKTVLLNPLSNCELNSKPLSVELLFPKVLDLTRFQVFELGHEYIGLHDVYSGRRLKLLSRDCKQKLVLLRGSSTDSGIDSDEFIMLGYFRRLFRCLAVLRSGKKDWTVIEDVNNVQDIVSFNGKFYAIDGKGRAVVIDRGLNVSFLGRVGSGSSYSQVFLVKSVDDLLAVEMFFLPDKDQVVCGFRALRLNEGEEKWEMVSLRDWILFLSLQQSVSAPASEFGWSKGNLVFYPKDLFNPRPCHDYEDRLMGVYDLVTGTSSH